MANIGISKASYYADTSLVRFSNEGVKSVDRLSSAQSDVVNGEIATLSGMNYTFKMDVAAAKASIKSLSTTQAYLTTAITALDNASHTLSQIQELAVLGANGSNSEADHAAFNARAEELADQFHNVMSGSKYKNENIFDPKRLNATMANGSGGSIDFGLAEIDYDFFYDYKNPEISILNEGIEYEITKDLTADQKAAILSRTTGLSEDQLVVGFRFTTDINPNENVGNGSVSIIDGRPLGVSPYDTLTYTRGDALVQFDPTADVLSEEEFAGGSIEIEISENSEDADNLSIQTIGRISINNATGIVSYNDPDDGWLEVGTVKEAQNGQNGKILRIDLFDDATKPGTGDITNGDFELPLRQQGEEPEPRTTYGVWKDDVVTGYAISSGGAGYVPADDTNITGKARGSDTYNIAFQGGTGSGFRANVIVAGGSITGIEVIDKGEGYVVGDVLTIAGDHFSAGAGFQLTITAVDRQVVQETIASNTEVPVIEFWDNPANDPGEADARYPWGEVYSDGDVKKILVSENEAVNPGGGAVLTNKLHIDSGSYDNVNIGGNVITWQNDAGVDKYSINGNPFDGQYIRGDNIKLFNQAKLNGYTAVKEIHTTGPGTYDEVEWGVDWIDDATDNENYRTNGGVWDGSYALGAEKLERSDVYVAGATTIYEANVNAGTYDEAEWGVTWQNGAGEINYRTNAAAWDGSYAIGSKKLVKLDNPAANTTAVYVRNTAALKAAEGPRYDWGAEIIVGDKHRVIANIGDPGAVDTNYIHENNGTYDEAEWGLTWRAGNGNANYKLDANTEFGDFLQDTIVYEKSNAGIAVYEAWTEAGTYDWGEAYAAGDIKKTRTQTGTRVVGEIEVPEYRFDNVVAFHIARKTLLTKEDVAFYTQEKVAFYTKENEAFYVANDQVWVAEATDGSTITRYDGEVDPNPNPNGDQITSYVQDTLNLIQNWYVSELADDGTPRINFGAGNQAGSFTIKDSDNGALITSSLALNDDANRYVDNSVEITVPTPSWETMKTFNDGAGSPAYEPYTDANGDTWVSNPAKEDRDDGGLQETSDDWSVGLVAGRTGNAIELDTGQIRFDDDNRFGIYHGPAIVSDEFTAAEGQILRLEYTAQGQNDDYHVAGYVYEVDDNGNAVLENGQPKFTIALMETGSSINNGRASIDIESDGKYRFVFIVGTHDLTGGKVAGANMTIDNIVVEWPAQIDNEVIEAILQSVHYENNSDTSTATKTLKATITNEDGSTKLNDTALINMSGFNVTGEGGPFMMVPLDNLVTNPKAGVANGSASALTSKVEILQQKIDALRTQAGSKVSAIDSAIDSATDLRSQFALASGTLSDINFSLETVHAAKRQIQQDVAAAMMAQANKAQDGMLSLVAEVETKS